MTPQIQFGVGARTQSGIGARTQSDVGARLQKDTSDTVRRWSSDIVRRWSSAVKRHLGCSSELEVGRKRTPPHGKHFDPEVWRKHYKALIKADNLKGLLGCPTCELFEFSSAILKIGHGKIC